MNEQLQPPAAPLSDSSADRLVAPEELLRAAVIGGAAGVAGTFAMNNFGKFWAKAQRNGDGDLRRRERQVSVRGGRPDVLAGAERARITGEHQSDATVRSARLVAKKAGLHPLSEEHEHDLAMVNHYLFGISAGAAYGIATALWPNVRSGFGAAFGAALWVAAVQIALPAAGLMAPPQRFKLRHQVFSIAAHVVYGTATEGARRVISRVA